MLDYAAPQRAHVAGDYDDWHQADLWVPVPGRFIRQPVCCSRAHWTAPETRAHIMVLALQASVKLAESDGVPGRDLLRHQQRLVGGEAVCCSAVPAAACDTRP
jgi:hypothetical protein